LKQQGVPYFEQLPLMESEEEVVPRSAEEIAARAIACLLTIQIACDMAEEYGDIEESRKLFGGFLERFGVRDKLTDKEKVFFDPKQIPDKQDVMNMTWRYEAYWALLWALGLLERLDYPDDTCDCRVAITTVGDRDNFADFMKNVKLRSMSEILDELDLLYRYHWACVDAQINERPAPAKLHGGVVRERRHGLEWIIGKDKDNGDDWDYISLDT
jgi:hypothetical protein